MAVDRLLVLSHDMSRTGAPIALLRYLRWLARERTVEVTVVVPRAGDLVMSYAEVATVLELQSPSVRAAAATTRTTVNAASLVRSRAIKQVLRGAETFGASAERRLRGRALRNVAAHDCILVNSVASGDMLDLISSPAPVVTWVHEMGFTIDHLLPERAWPAVVERTDHFVAVGEAVVEDLVRRRIPRDRIDVCSGFVEGGSSDVLPRSQVLPEITEGAFVVAACGSRDWRKGFDLFARTAQRVIELDRQLDAHFVWVGGHAAPLVDAQFCYDAEKLGVRNRVHLVPSAEDVSNLLAAADVFLLPSREDPYPLVCIEAAALGTPLVTFDSGGGAELARTGAGVVVPYGDVDEMAAALVHLAQDEARRAAMAGIAQAIAADHTADVLAPRLSAVLDAR